MARDRGSKQLLIDLSAWARSANPLTRQHWAEMLRADRLNCHPVFALELLHNAYNPIHYQELRNDLENAFDWLWPDSETLKIALQLQQRMATTAAAGQRVKTADILTAALAVQNDVGVLHYDSDYDSIAARGGEPFQSVWLAERGTLETTAELNSNVRRRFSKALGERMIQLREDADLELWPELIAWLDQQLCDRGIEQPPAPDVA